MTQLLAILFLALPVGACSDSEDPGQGDTGQDVTADAEPDSQPDGGGPPAECWTSDTSTNFASESGDWADCLPGAGCDNDAVAFFNFNDGFTRAGWSGQIDGNDHVYAGVTDTGPDRDLFGVIMPARTLLTLYVEPTAGSELNAVIRTDDGEKGLTFNADAEADSRSARTQVAAPWAGELAFYFYVEHHPNYSNFPPQGDVDFEGGNHGYTVRFETTPLSIVELGELSASNTTLSGSGQLDCYGDLTYYRFTGSGVDSVSVTSTGASEYTPFLASMDTAGGGLRWSRMDFDGSGPDGNRDGTVSLPGNAFGGGELIFAVTDINGWAGPGDFTFNVSVNGN